jgi:hypothetical protein
MNDSSRDRAQNRELDDAIEQDPKSRHGDEGEAVNEGRQAGPNSARSGEPIAPQTGDPLGKDRRPN